VGTTQAQITGELARLARAKATGVLRIDGSPNGAIYLDGGRITFGESSGAPGIGVRLTGSRRLPESQWRMLTADRPTAKTGELLVEQGLVTRDELKTILRSATLDAIIALTVPAAAAPAETAPTPVAPADTGSAAAGPPPVSFKFIARQRHWAGSVIRLDFGTVRGEITRSAGRPAQERIEPVACPKLSDARRAWAIVSREQWLVACWIDGRTSVWDLAWRNGFALTDTCDRVSELVSQGLCIMVDPSERTRASGPAPLLPRRQRGATLPDKPVTRARISSSLHDPEEIGAAPAPPSPELLNRLLDGLRRMD
jgi:hypothetical protein